MLNWKTTVCGILAAIGTYLVSQPDPLHTVGMVLAAVATALLGLAAKDHNQ